MSYVTLPSGQRLFYLQRGPTGSIPILFIHGAAGHATLWGHVLRLLPEANSIILDLPGHGRSDPPPCRTVQDDRAAIEGLAAALRLPPAVVVGHSLGGAIALDLALHRPDTVRALALISATGYLPIEPALLQQLLADPDRTRRWLVEAGYGPGATPAALELGLQRLATVPDRVLHDDIEAGATYDPRPCLAKIRRPTLVLCGASDRLTPPLLVQAMARAIPHARFRQVPGAGHLLPIEQPAAVAAAMTEFLQSLA